MILLIDNYDSFTWNLVHLVAGAQARKGAAAAHGIVVARNDEMTVEAARGLDGGRGPSHLIVSPGPCGPPEAGVSVEMIRAFAGRIPVLGVCLGHQCIAAAFGMRIERLDAPVHGLATPVHHDGRGLFEGLPNPLDGARYHSLIVPEAELNGPEHGGVRRPVSDAGAWEVSAWAGGTAGEGRIVMGMRRVWADARTPALEGVQFHPESFLTEHGSAMASRFLGGSVGDSLGP